jgi:hypothetical protein
VEAVADQEAGSRADAERLAEEAAAAISGPATDGVAAQQRTRRRRSERRRAQPPAVVTDVVTDSGWPSTAQESPTSPTTNRSDV